MSLSVLIIGLTFVAAGCEADPDVGLDNDLAVDNTEPEFESIFDGETLDGWDGWDRFWGVEDGVIVGESAADNPAPSNTFLVWEGGEPADFEMTFDYRFLIVSDEEYGNSGIQIRSEQFTDPDHPENEWRVRGYQPDFAISDWIPGILYEEATGRDILARRGQRVVIDSEGESHEERFAEEDELGEHIHLHTEWNAYHVEARGDTIRTWINDELMHEVIDQSPEARQEGILAFQVHSGPPMRVELRDVMLRTFD